MTIIENPKEKDEKKKRKLQLTFKSWKLSFENKVTNSQSGIILYYKIELRSWKMQFF